MRLVDNRSPKLRKLQKAISLQKNILKRDPEFRKTLKPNSETGSVASSSHKSKLSISTKASKKSDKSQKPIPPRSWVNKPRKKSSQPSSNHDDDDEEWWDEEEESEEEDKVSESDHAHLLSEDEGAPSESPPLPSPKKPPSKTPSHASYKGHSSWGHWSWDSWQSGKWDGGKDWEWKGSWGKDSRSGVSLPTTVQTPHEELATIFAKLELKYRHDELLLNFKNS
jgi:hypothetical protein